MKYGFLFVVFFIWSCNSETKKQENTSIENKIDSSKVSLIVLGTIQDAGSPHIGCKKECCKALFNTSNSKRKVVSLGIVDSETNKTFLFEATPDITTQLKNLKQIANSEKELPDGIFLTHAHIGHYTGLMYLGKEAINASRAKVYVMPKMKTFLEENGPWSQLVNNHNIELALLQNQESISLTATIEVTPFSVPHRDEYSETVGFKIKGPNKSILFIPDIDKWEKWETSIIEAISTVDYAFLDATFYDGDEINTRDISEIPHPFIIESMELFKRLPLSEKQKIYFIHFNHTNPVLKRESEAYNTIISNGFNVSEYHQILNL